MSLENITTLSVEAFRERTAGKKVVLLYPWTNYRTVFLSYFLKRTNKGILYFRIPQDRTSLTEWLSALSIEFSQRLNGFGAQLQQVLADRGGASQLGAALAADLNAYVDQPITLFLDELDRTPLDVPFRNFVESLVAGVGPGVQIAVSSRCLTYQPWYDLVASGRAVVLGTERRKDDVIFSHDAAGRPRLEVYAFGEGHVLMNGEAVTNWDGALPRNLLFYFMDRPLVTRDEIFTTFWPNLPVKEATNVFHVTKRKISERISMKVDEGGCELTQYRAGFYSPSETLVRYYDVGDFQAAVEAAMIATSDAEEEHLLMEAIELYKLPYLERVSLDWVRTRRDHLCQLYAQALIGLGRIHKRRKDFPRALGFFIRSLKETPEREDIHREVLSIYLKLGMVADARLHYANLLRAFKQTYGISPSKETQEIYKLIETSS